MINHLIGYTKIILVLMALVLLLACMAEDPRSMASTDITVTYNGEQFQPQESIVPAGEEINVTLQNDSSSGFTWYVVLFPINEERGFDDEENVLFSANVSAGEKSTFQFSAPLLTARYDSFCVPDDDTEKRALKYLLVVEPYAAVEP